MSIPHSVLQNLQQAGQGIHQACLTLTEAVNASASKLVSSIANDPFSPESEEAFSRIRAMARLGHDLTAIEAKLREIYDQAQKLSQPAPATVVMALAGLSRILVAKQQKPEDADDVSDKRDKSTESIMVKSSTSLTPNDLKLLNGLKGILNRKSYRRMTQAAMAEAAGIPSGSVGLSLKRLVVAGRVLIDDERGYRLARA